jgi:hypothetical protein
VSKKGNFDVKSDSSNMRQEDGTQQAGRHSIEGAVTRQEARFNFRLSRDNRLLIEQAAALEGKNLKEFVQGAALAQARRVLVEYRLIQLGLPAPVAVEVAGEPGPLETAFAVSGRCESVESATLREEAAALRSLLADAAATPR